MVEGRNGRGKAKEEKKKKSRKMTIPRHSTFFFPVCRVTGFFVSCFEQTSNERSWLEKLCH